MLKKWVQGRIIAVCFLRHDNMLRLPLLVVRVKLCLEVAISEQIHL